jgi:hypothetical protein
MNDNTTYNYETNVSRTIKFIVFLPLQLVALPACIFVVYHLVAKPALRRSLPNHVFIALNIVTLLDITLQQLGSMIFFRLDHVWPESDGYCVFWNYMDFIDYSLNLHLTAWALLERQYFIFDPHFCSTHKKRILYHFTPLLIIIIGTLMFYSGVIIFNPCKNNFDYGQSWCGDVCFLENKVLYLFDWIINGLVPFFLIVLLSMALFIRVIRHKNRIQQSFVWSKHRKLTIQVLSISSLYTVCFLPSISIAITSKLLNDPKFGIELQTPYLEYLPILGRTLMPFLTIGTVPELLKIVKTCLVTHDRCRGQVTVAHQSSQFVKTLVKTDN